MAQINLIPKLKKRKFPFWGIIIAAILLNLIIFLLVSQEKATNDQSIPLPTAQSRVIGGSIAYDGEYFWATGMLITFGSKTDRDIVQFGNDGSVINVFTLEEDFCGFAFDGAQLWTADAQGRGPYVMNSKFYTVNMYNGKLVEQFTINRDYLLDGIAANEYRLWVIGRYRTSEEHVFLWEIDQYSKSIVHEVALPSSEFHSCSGITFFKDYIFAVVGIEHKQVLKISTYEGRITERFDFSGRDIYGITNNGEEVLVADGRSKALFTLDTTPALREDN